MRFGFTTGSCAAAASKAAAYMLLTGKKKTEISIETPKGILFPAQIVDIEIREDQVCCAVVKDGGDDPDVTTGAKIFATVSYSKTATHGKESCQKIFIDGGSGVGRVTKPGLDQPVGNAAINHVPREMIENEVLEVCRVLDYTGGLSVIISVLGGEKIAGQTFNPRLGIVGGISILGTSGIVEPMSNQAILDTIRVELNQRKAQGYSYVAVAPGNYGLDFMKQTYGYDLDRSVKCSNFIGDTIDIAVELGFERMLLTGHIGKLIKVSGGMMNTHSQNGDCRMELMAAFAMKAHVDPDKVREILECISTEEAVRILKQTVKERQVLDLAMERIMFHLNKRAKGKLQIDCMMYATEFGELAKSKEAESWFTLLAQEQEQQI